MSQTSGSAVLIGVLALAGLGMLVAFRSGARSGHRLARHSQEVTRMGGNLVRALGAAVLIVAVQWAVVWFTSDPRAWAVVLGVPALFAGSAIARMFSVTEIIYPDTHRRRSRR
jgi:protein-S-isoprenylcysteine O-methyltransferase Ste14